MSLRRQLHGTLVTAAVLGGLVVGTGVSSGVDGSPALGRAAEGNVDVTAYDVAEDYQPDTRTIRGTTAISATATEALAGFTLHLGGAAGPVGGGRPGAGADVIAVSIGHFTLERSARPDGTPVVTAYVPRPSTSGPAR
ncbi:hypothetical protein [Actinophytocola sp.]|uniref:hypothetical protein n=1 Tax=Actinophytocola sp. TaxID=1872138 RepID=UPI00389A069D